jgi:hypothetical protein
VSQGSRTVIYERIVFAPFRHDNHNRIVWPPHHITLGIMETNDYDTNDYYDTNNSRNNNNTNEDGDDRGENLAMTPGADQLLNLFVPPPTNHQQPISPSIIIPNSNNQQQVPHPPLDEDEHLLKTPHARSSHPMQEHAAAAIESSSRSVMMQHDQTQQGSRDRSTSLADLFLPRDESTALLSAYHSRDEPYSASGSPYAYSSYQPTTAVNLDDSISSTNFYLAQQATTTKQRNINVKLQPQGKLEPEESPWQAFRNKYSLHPSTLAGSLSKFMLCMF